jgi:hypothetical protein
LIEVRSDPLYHQDWVPRKILSAKRDIGCSPGGSADGQARGKDVSFCLIPFTNQLKGIDMDIQCASNEIKTDIKIPGTVPEEVLVLKDPTIYDHVVGEEATKMWRKEHGEFILDAFWKMERTDREANANMRMTDVIITLGYGVTLPGIAERGGGHDAVSVPVAVPMRDIKKNEPLVLYVPKAGRKMEPKAKLDVVKT